MKSTEGSQISIKLQDINTLFYNANVSHKVPIFINQFIDGPILISMRLEDIGDIEKYLCRKVVNKERFCDIIQISTSKDNKKIIKNNNKNKIKRKLEKEKINKYERRK